MEDRFGSRSSTSPAAAIGLDPVRPPRGSASDRRSEPADDRRGVPATPRWFVVGLISIVLAGIVMRIMFAVFYQDGARLSGDPAFFQQVGAQLARGNGYAVPRLGGGPLGPTALHPPMFPLVLALLDLVGISSPDAHRIALAFVSAGGIVAMGFLGRRLLGPPVGLIAAGIAALSPLWVQPSGKILSESLYLVVVPLLLLAALRCVERPTPWRFAVVGLAIGVATVTRSEALSLVVLLGIPLLIFAARPWPERLRLAVLLVAGVALVVGPWLIRNDLQMGAATLSTDGGTTWVGANTASTYAPSSPAYGSFDGSVQFGVTGYIEAFMPPPDHAKHWTEVALSNELTHLGKTYARNHLADVPGVVLAREGRMIGFYRPGNQLQFDLNSDGDGVWVFQVAGQYFTWALYPFVVVGAVVLYRQSRRELLIMVMPIAAAVFTAALAFGSTRYRSVAEPSFAVLAAIGLFWLVQSVRHRTTNGKRTFLYDRVTEADAPDNIAGRWRTIRVEAETQI